MFVLFGVKERPCLYRYIDLKNKTYFSQSIEYKTQSANYANSYFTKIGEYIQSSVPSSNTDFRSFLHPSPSWSNEFFIRPTDPNELIHINKHLKSTTFIEMNRISMSL